MEVYLVMLIHLLIVLMATVPADFDTILCDGTEVCWPGLQYNISCICHPSSTHCFWTTFADQRRNLTNGTTESLLVWHSNTIGYGQFTCISRDSSSADNIERNVLIIPNVRYISCDGCITTRICRTATRKYLMQFSKLFNQSLLAGNCELYYTNRSLLRLNGTISEEDCVELLPSFNYCIQCPICYPHSYTIYYEISISDIENCSDSDTCSSQPSTTTTTSAMTSSIASETTTTNISITMTTTSTSFAVTTTMNMSGGVSNGNNENNDGIIIAAVVVVVAVVLLIMTIIICTVLFYRHNHNKKKSTHVAAINEVAISRSFRDIDMEDNARPRVASNGIHTVTSDAVTTNEVESHLDIPLDDAISTQLELTQNKLHSEQERAHGLEMDYRQQSVELRKPGPGVTREELVNDGMKLENQLRNKDEEVRAQEDELGSDNSASRSTDIITRHDQLLKCSHSQLISEITRLHVTIEDHINFENLIPFLNKYAIFTKVEIKFFMNHYYSDADKVNNLIMWLPKKDENEIHNFVKALVEAQEHSGHLVILNHLHERIFPES